MGSFVVARDGNVHVVQSRVCVAQGDGRQVNIRRLCERLLVGPGMGNHHNSRLWKASWIWLVKVPGVKHPAIGVAPGAAANFSTAHWLVFLDNVALTSARFSKATIA